MKLNISVNIMTTSVLRSVAATTSDEEFRLREVYDRSVLFEHD